MLEIARPPVARSRRYRARLPAALALCVALNACSSFGFYTQAVAGHIAVWRAERPLDDALDDASLPSATRAQLRAAAAMRDFAFEHLALPDRGSYRSYADLGRDHIVWNVFAAPEFDLTPVQSCFVFAGCLDYRGYFRRAAATRYAAGLQARGHDVYIGGVAAYSTLGWFDDPLLNTFVTWPEADTARVIFHELAHQRLYIENDTRFNESFASAVAEAGVRAWFATRPGPAPAERERRERFQVLVELVFDTRAALAALYAAGTPGAALRQAKAAAFERLQRDYERLRAHWDEGPTFDAWMAEPWNNARIVSIATYNDLVDAFLLLLDACDGDFARFYTAAAAYGALDPTLRHRRLEALSAEAAHCPAAPRHDG